MTPQAGGTEHKPDVFVHGGSRLPVLPKAHHLQPEVPTAWIATTQNHIQRVCVRDTSGSVAITWGQSSGLHLCAQSSLEHGREGGKQSAHAATLYAAQGCTRGQSLAGVPWGVEATFSQPELSVGRGAQVGTCQDRTGQDRTRQDTEEWARHLSVAALRHRQRRVHALLKTQCRFAAAHSASPSAAPSPPLGQPPRPAAWRDEKGPCSI